MDLSMRVTGGETKPMVAADSFMLMETYMKENGKMTRLMGSASTITQMELDMKGIGEKISNMGMARKPGLMVHVMRASTRTARKTALENSTGQTAPLIKGSSLIIISMVSVSTPGRMGVNTTAIG